MANIAKTYTFVNGQPADATQVNKNFDDIIAGVGDISAAGHALIDDANAAAQLVTLGTAAYSEGTWMPVLNGFTFVGTAPVLSGKWRRIGNLVYVEAVINVGGGGNTSIAGGSNISGIPIAPAGASVAAFIGASSPTYLAANGYIYVSSLGVTTAPIYFSATYCV